MMLRGAAFGGLLLFLFGVQSLFAQEWDQYIRRGQYSKAIPLLLKAYREDPENVLVLLQLGKAYLTLEKTDSAYIFLSKAYEEKRRDPEVARYYALALAHKGKIEEAIELLQDRIEDDKDNVHLYLTLAQVYLLADSIQRADYVIRKAQQINPELPHTYIALGDLYYAQKVYPLARMNYEEALRRDSTLIEPRIKLAKTYYALARRAVSSRQATQYYLKAYHQWDALTKLDPENPVPYKEKGRLLFYARRYKGAIEPLKKYLSMKPDDQKAAWWLAQSLAKARQCEDAVQWYEKLLPSLEDSLKQEAWLEMARCFFNLKQYAKSYQFFRLLDSIAANKLTANDYERFGYAALQVSDTALAIAKFRRAVNLDTTKCRLLFTLGNFLRERKQYQDAIAVFQQRNRYCADSLVPRVNLLIGVSFFSDGNVDSAIVYLERALQQDTTLLFDYIQLAYAYYEKGADTKADSLLVRAIQIARSDTAQYHRELQQAYSALASKLLERKKHQKLLQLTAEWVKLQPRSVYANLFRAIAYHSLNNPQEACRYYRIVLKLDPQNSTAQQNAKLLQCP